MKHKFIFVPIIILTLLFPACNSAGTSKAVETSSSAAVEPVSTPEQVVQESSEPESTPVTVEVDYDYELKPAVDVSLKEVEIDGGLIKLSIPDSLEISDQDIGTVFHSKGYLKDEDGNDLYCSVYVTMFYQEEEPQLDYEMMNTLLEPNLIMEYGPNMGVNRIRNIETPSGAKGFYSLVTYGTGDGPFSRYFMMVQGDGAYYNINIVSPTGAVTPELAEQILTSVDIDKSLEKKAVDGFELNIKDGFYNSPRLEGARIVLPPDWNPTESSVAIYDNIVLSITSGSNDGFINVKRYEKGSSITDMEIFYYLKAIEAANAGISTFSNVSELKIHKLESGRILVEYPCKILFLQCQLEYEDAYYSVDMFYHGEDYDVYEQAFIAMLSFEAPGAEILPE